MSRLWTQQASGTLSGSTYRPGIAGDACESIKANQFRRQKGGLQKTKPMWGRS